MILCKGSPGKNYFSNFRFPRRFVSAFCVEPIVVLELWREIEKATLVTEPRRSPKYLLWALYFLTKYTTEGVAAGKCGCHEDTYRKWCWLYVEALARLTEVSL
jgi:hypothetical protein